MLAIFPAECDLVSSFIGVRISLMWKLWTISVISDNFNVEENIDFLIYLFLLKFGVETPGCRVFGTAAEISV